MKDRKTQNSYFSNFKLKFFKLKKNEILKFAKTENCGFNILETCRKILKKLQKLAKLEHADINLKIAAKCGPQKVNDIKIHTPARGCRP